MTHAAPGSRTAGWRHPDVWLFDLDNTLYPASCRLFDQMDRRITQYIAGYLAVTADQANTLRRDLWAEHGTTLNGLMHRHKMPPGPFLEFVHDLDLAGLAPGEGLGTALAALPGRKIVFTNGSHGHAERILGRLGITNHFEAIHDIVAADYVPKPVDATCAAVVARFGLNPHRTVMVEDSPVNLPPAARLGMTTVWVLHAPEAEPGAAADHIHHVTDDLSAWLSGLTGGPAAGKSAQL
jgi:putative hydrolase of the HAD superfamily